MAASRMTNDSSLRVTKSVGMKDVFGVQSSASKSVVNDSSTHNRMDGSLSAITTVRSRCRTSSMMECCRWIGILGDEARRDADVGNGGVFDAVIVFGVGG